MESKGQGLVEALLEVPLAGFDENDKVLSFLMCYSFAFTQPVNGY